MKEIRILHLFPKLLSLYGDYGNVAVLKRTLEALDASVTVEQWEEGELNLDGIHMVYVGAGTEEALWEANLRLQPHKAALQKAICDGLHFLATGNAMALFGKELTFDGETADAVNAFAYTTSMTCKKRYLADALAKDAQGNVFVGFINTGCVYQDVQSPAMALLLNPQLGNNKQTGQEGILENNFYGTQLIGPVLTKNPHLLSALVEKLTGSQWQADKESYLQKAYEIAKQELTKRLEVN